MANFEQEQFYYVDPGIGKKKRGCPYTLYKDGRDVRMFIVPPKGYELDYFEYEPTPEDTFYDGKIVAQFKKAKVSNKVGLAIRKGLLAILYSIPIIGLLAIMAFFLRIIIWGPTPKSNVKPKPKKTIVIDTLAQKQVSDTSTFAELITKEEPVSNEILTQENAESQEVQEQEVQEEVLPVEEPVEIKNEIEKPIEVKEVKNEKEEIAQKPEQVTTPTQEPQQAVTSTKEQFKQEFWDLIHQQEKNMGTYFDLYNRYKNENLKSKEFFYLYLTILENTKEFNNWKAKLVKIPADEIKSIHTISALTEKLEQYE